MIARHPVWAGLGGAVLVWGVIVASVFWDELRGVRRDVAAKRVAVRGVSSGSAVRFAVELKTAPAGASTPSGSLTAPSRTTREDG